MLGTYMYATPTPTTAPTGGESGSADTVRDPRGFAVKFYTEDGNWDLVGNNTPIFFIRDPIFVSHYHHIVAIVVRTGISM